MSPDSVNNLGMSPAVIAAAAAAAALPTALPSLSLTSLLGMTADEISQQMRAGRSLEAIARSKNVSQAALAAAVKATGLRELSLSPRPEQSPDRHTARPAEQVAPGDLPARAAHHRDGVRSPTGPRAPEGGRKAEGPGQRAPGQTDGAGSRDVDPGRSHDVTGHVDLAKGKGIDPTTPTGGSPKGMIIDTTA